MDTRPIGVFDSGLGGLTAGVSRVIYAVVGIAGLWCITMLFRKKGRQEA